MNLPDIHTQKLLDCLTHSRLGFALYRITLDRRMLPGIANLGRCGTISGHSGTEWKERICHGSFPDIGGTSLGTYPSGCHRIRLERNQRSTVFTGMCGCLAHLQNAGRVNSPLLFPKKRIKNNIPAHSGVSSLPYKRSGSRNWFCHVLPPDISEMIFHHSALLSGPATTIRA